MRLFSQGVKIKLKIVYNGVSRIQEENLIWKSMF